MDVTSLFMFCLISLVIGAVLMLIVQYYIYVRFCHMPSASLEQKNINKKYALPQDIQENATKFDSANKSPLMALNLIMQFLFHELKHTTRVRKWFYRKLSLELDELVAKTTTGILFEKLTLKDLDLGDQFPELQILRVHDVDIHDTEGRIEKIDLLLQIKYTGNFRVTVDADMVLGKKASLTLQVKHLSGLARLQFTRNPYSHWSLSFLGDPELELGIESKFQGRQMQSNISSLISNQIRRAVRRKHTLPQYKIRYKPFFHKIDDEIDSDVQPNGYLEVKVTELSRLLIPNSSITDVYCTLTMTSLAWVEAKYKDDRNILVSIDVKIHKAKNQQIGILFRQGEIYVEIEAVLPNTPAIKSKLKSGDTLISIEGTRVNSIQQVAKLVKGLNNSVFILRIERTIPGVLYNDPNFVDLDVYEDFGESKTVTPQKSNVPSDEQLVQSTSIGNSATRQVRTNTPSESNTPTNSPKKTKLIAKAIKKTLSREPTEVSVLPSVIEKKPPTIKLKIRDETVTSTSDAFGDIEYYQQHSTNDCSIDQLIHMKYLCRFKLDPNCKYLNVCVYGKCPAEPVLLGFLNIPIRCLISECSETSLIETVKAYNLMPPVIQDLKSHSLSSLSGFDPKLCFGDILMAFSWDGNPIPSSDPIKKPSKTKCSSDKVEETEKSEIAAAPPKTHNFIRTHFHRATQCDFCGKKIWLKDAVQCRDCNMNCHKKCVLKCELSTVCGPVDCSGVMDAIATLQPEFTVTEPQPSVAESYVSLDEQQASNEQKETTDSGHRQSLTGLIAQGLKRVNSANNLAIPGISTPVSQNSRSLPQSPQHSPRKQSLVNMGISPFIIVIQILESFPNDLEQLTNEQINNTTEPIINIGRDEDVMTMAKEASKELFNELSATERVDKINELLTKLRLALDSETANHSKLLETNPNENSIIKSVDSSRVQNESDAGPLVLTNNKEILARRAFDLGKSEERVQALSVIMLYLCTGLQHAQGVASQ